jgi:hypothetical protein
MFNAIVVTLGFLAFPAVCVWIIAVINYGAVVSNAARERGENKARGRHVSPV